MKSTPNSRGLSSWLVVVLAFACADPVATPRWTDVSGEWAFTGRLEQVACYDTMTISMQQSRDALSGVSHDWHFWCNGERSGLTPILTAVGQIRTDDSIRLLWRTDLGWECGGCETFHMSGHATPDSMQGRYIDHWFGGGAWQAIRSGAFTRP